MTSPEALRAYATKNDAEAFRLLVHSYQRLVYSAAARRLARAHDIEDTVQLTFLKLARAAGTIKNDLSSWLYTTALNTANDLIRSDASRRRHETAAALSPQTPTPSTEADREELQQLTRLLDEALLQLPPDQQSLIIEHFFQSRSQRDLATELKTTQATISRRLTAAVEALRTRLRAQGCVAATTLLATSMHTLAQSPVPAPLTANLTKIGLTGASHTPGTIMPAASAKSAALRYFTTTSLAVKIALTSAAIIAIATFAVLPSKPPPSSTVAASAPPAPAATAPALEAWRTAFEKAYALLPTQNLKFIPTAQFPPERKQYFSEIEHNETLMPFIQWRLLAQPAPTTNSTLKREMMSSNGPRGASLDQVLNFCAGLDQSATDISALPPINADGDWIVRDTAPTQAILDDLRAILATHFNLPVKIEKLEVVKDALILTGNYQFTRLTESTNRNNLEIFADVLDHPRQGQPTMGGGTRPPAFLWSYLGDQFAIPIVDESKNEPATISWSLSRSIAGALNNPAKRQQILDNLTKQTTLTFKQEKHTFPTWKFIPAPAPRATAPTAPP